MFRNKLSHWFKRYFLAELLSLIISLVFASAGKYIGTHGAIIAYLGMIGGNAGFYGTMILKEYASHRKLGHTHTTTLFKTARNIILEFGPAEYLDSFILRPFYLFTFPLFIPNFALAITLGNIAADLTFYIPSIISYEIRKKYIE